MKELSKYLGQNFWCLDKVEANVAILVYSYNVKLESLTHEEVFGRNYGATFQAPKFLAVISSILSRSIFSQSSPMFIKLHLWKDNCTGDPFICWNSFEHLETLLEDGRDALYMGFWGAWPLPDNRVDKFYDYLDDHSSSHIWIMFWILFYNMLNILLTLVTALGNLSGDAVAITTWK